MYLVVNFFVALLFVDRGLGSAYLSYFKRGGLVNLCASVLLVVIGGLGYAYLSSLKLGGLATV